MGGDPNRGHVNVGANNPAIDPGTLLRNTSLYRCPDGLRVLKSHSGLCFPLLRRSIKNFSYAQ